MNKKKKKKAIWNGNKGSNAYNQFWFGSWSDYNPEYNNISINILRSPLIQNYFALICLINYRIRFGSLTLHVLDQCKDKVN